MNIQLNDTPYSVSDISRLADASRTTVYQWIQAFGQKEFNVACIEQGKAKKYPASLWQLCLERAGQVVNITPTTPTYADPFAGVQAGGAMVPAGFQAQNRSLATTAAAQRVQSICQGANLHTQQTVTAALESGDQMGQQLGAFLAERTIAAAETQRQQLIAEYLKSQGVSTDPKSGADDGSGQG